MSIKVMSEVWESAPVKGSALLVLLALADNAEQETRRAWPSVEDLARRARIDRRSAQRALRSLEEQGLITVALHGGHTNDGDGRATVYVVMPRGGRQNAAQGGRSLCRPNRHNNLGSRSNDLEPVFSPEIEGLVDFFIERASAFHESSVRPSRREAWLEAMDKLVRIDGRSPEQVRSMIEWLYSGRSFYGAHIKSVPKLRAQRVKLREEYRRQRERPVGLTPSDQARRERTLRRLGEGGDDDGAGGPARLTAA